VKELANELTGYEIFRRIFNETEGGKKFSEHLLAKKIFKERA